MTFHAHAHTGKMGYTVSLQRPPFSDTASAIGLEFQGLRYHCAFLHVGKQWYLAHEI